MLGQWAVYGVTHSTGFRFANAVLRPGIAGMSARHSYTGSAMPIYEYRCENGHTFEAMQRMTDDPLTECTICGAPVQRVFHPVAVHFKGSGFYNTDYGKKKAGASSARRREVGVESGRESDSKSPSRTRSRLQLLEVAARPCPRD